MDSGDKYKVIGVMSGTSLDGVDLVCCVIRKRDEQWLYTIEAAQTVKYSRAWQKKLHTARDLPGEALLDLHNEYGKYLGVLIQAFMIKYKLRGVHFVASHGHTVFHQPQKGLTFQLGDGTALYAACGMPVIYDFRSLDVVLGGQGAPLAPVGDRLLFHEYDVCLNIGGIANVSMEVKSKRIAFDVCFANMGLNYLAAKAGQGFDKNGAMAAKGAVHEPMLAGLKKIYDRFRNKRPALGYEIFTALVMPVLDNEEIALHDRLATFVESVACEIVQAVPGSKKDITVLCTGGGAFNSFLVYRLAELFGDAAAVIIPEDETVKFKEALVFALLGMLRVRNEINCLKSVTGARADSSSGMMVGFAKAR